MRKSISLLVILTLALFLAACGQSPRNVAKSFTENLAQGKLVEAKAHATDQTAQLLDMAAAFGSLQVDPDFQFIFVEQSIEGDRALVKFRDSKDGEIDEVELLKIDGKWKVHASK